MDATLFIGTVIAGVTQAIKSVIPQVTGWVTILVAVIIGIAIALLDKEIGVADITIAQGVMIALGTVGVFAAVDRIKA